MIRKIYKFKKNYMSYIKSFFPKSIKYINLGSGNTRFLGWTNLDYSGGQKKIPSFYIDVDFDLTGGKPLPFVDNSVDYVFCSHVFEHLNEKTVLHICSEVFRILKNHGIFRVIVPNPEFENIKQVLNSYSHETNNLHISRWELNHLREILFGVGFHFVYNIEPFVSSVKKMKKKSFSSNFFYSNIIECSKRVGYLNYTVNNGDDK